MLDFKIEISSNNLFIVRVYVCVFVCVCENPEYFLIFNISLLLNCLR